LGGEKNRQCGSTTQNETLRGCHRLTKTPKKKVVSGEKGRWSKGVKGKSQGLRLLPLAGFWPKIEHVETRKGLSGKKEDRKKIHLGKWPMGEDEGGKDSTGIEANWLNNHSSR